MDKNIITEARNPDTVHIDLADSLEIARAINNEDKKVALAVEKVLPQVANAIDAAALSLQKGGRIAYFGAGTSGRIGVLDASECPPTFGVSPQLVQGFIAGGDKALRSAVENAEDSIQLAEQDFNAFAPSPVDVVIAISASGNPAYCLKVLQLAQEKGCTTVAVSSNPLAKMAEFADIFINPIVGEEAITGSSRMKSGTAQKMVLNMISTGAMVRIGKTYQNYMIDLQPTNKKLIERSIRFIAEICGLASSKAEEYFEKSGRNVKTACVMACRQCTKNEAEKLLAAEGGILRKVI